jgi:hypothetical protein
VECVRSDVGGYTVGGWGGVRSDVGGGWWETIELAAIHTDTLVH